MCLSHSIFSGDHFFSLGINDLLTAELIDCNYFIFDMETTDYSLIKQQLSSSKKLVIFITNDVDYYALRHLEGAAFIDKRSKLNEILSCLIVNDPRHFYQIKHKLSNRESEILFLMLEGLGKEDIIERLGINMKTFYAHRLRIINKLRIGNRVSLYSSIARTENYRGGA